MIEFDIIPLCGFPSSPLVSEQTRELIEHAFSHGGYVAGGFALLVARAQCVGELTKVDDNVLRTGHRFNKNTLVTGGKFAGTMNTDVDVFFPTIESRDACLESFSVRDALDRWPCRDSVTGSSLEIFVDGVEKVQIIRKFVAPVFDNVRRFDMFNAMCAFDAANLYVPKGWLELEKQRALHVANWNKWTVGRIFKYFSRKGYEVLTDETAAIFFDEAVKALAILPVQSEADKLLRGPWMNDALKELKELTPFKVWSKETLAKRLRAFYGSMSASQLLLLSGVGGDPGTDSYGHLDGPIQEIVRRALAPT